MPQEMTEERFKQLWEALVEGRQPSESDMESPLSVNNGSSPAVIEALEAYASGDTSKIDAFAKAVL